MLTPVAVHAQKQIAAVSEAAPASINGTVLDVNGTGIPGAQITLAHIGSPENYELTSGENGEFGFTNLSPGDYSLTINATAFDLYTSARFTMSAGQTYNMPSIQLSIAAQRQVVVVRPTEVIAEMQIKAQQKQRFIGVLPNFYTSYVWDAAPMNTKQKFSLSARDIFDPGTLLGVAATAGIQQANNKFAGYGQGASGYAKRFAAGSADRLIDGFLGQAVYASILHQDPRYFYQGSGSVKSRLVHALSWAVILRSDSGHPVPNYSYLLGDLSAGAISNLYYPSSSRGVGLVFTNFAIGVAARAGNGVFREFVVKHLTKNVAGKGKE
jgi:hypothetical protein